MFPLNRRSQVGVLTALWLLVSCASQGPAPPSSPETPLRSDPYLMAPVGGYPMSASADLEVRLDEAFTGLLAGRELAEVEAVGRGLLAEDPGFHPAAVLAAQVAYLRRDDRSAMELLAPVVDELPEYAAALLVFARAAERAGDLPLAFESFARIAASSDLAARRAEELRPRAFEIVLNRLRDEVSRRRVEGAEEHLEWLETWAGDSREALEGAQLVAAAEGDPEAELAAVRRLAAASDERRHLERLGELELEVGEVTSGLQLFERLVERFPEEAQLRDQLERAKFLWRLERLPAGMQEISRRAELERAGFATQLYWLVPQVRYAEVTNPPIAVDILDHPRRDEILRVLNLGLMEVDETLHRFEPEAPATRREVLRSLLALLQSSEQEFSCLAGAEALRLTRSPGPICQAAARCQLIPEEADCLPAASISGAEALELFRRTLDLLGSGG